MGSYSGNARGFPPRIFTSSSLPPPAFTSMFNSPFLMGLIALILSATGLSAQVVADSVSRPFRLDFGVNYLTGDYGFSESTEVWLETASLTYEDAQWRLQAMVPIVTITGPATVVGNVTPGSSGGTPRPTDRSETGLGDVLLGATHKFGPLGTGPNFDLTGRVKLPTADEDKGLGTGLVDVYVQADFYQTFGAITPFGSVGYAFLGSDDSYPLRDGFNASLGAAALVREGLIAGASLSWRAPIVDDGDDAMELLAFALKQLTSQWRVQGYVLTGFTEASPNLGVGGTVGYTF